MKSRNLVVARSGEKSLHMNWIKGAEPNFDLVVTFYGDEVPQSWGETDKFYEIIPIKGSKWKGLYQYLTNTDKWREYDYILLPDDDLLCSSYQINQLFDFAKNKNMDLCQPALDRNSYFSHPITLKHNSFNFRFTNFVELMIPCFSKRMLEATLSMFNESNSGFGMDYYWWEIICKNNFMMPAIIDDINITHTRPVGSAGHGVGAGGQSPNEELKKFFVNHNFKSKPLFSLGGEIRENGKIITANDNLPILNYLFLRDAISLSQQVSTPALAQYIIAQQNMTIEMKKTGGN